MSEKPTIGVFADCVYIKLYDGRVVALYGEGSVSTLEGEVTHYGGIAVPSLSSTELWEIVREVILERVKDEGH